MFKINKISTLPCLFLTKKIPECTKSQYLNIFLCRTTIKQPIHTTFRYFSKYKKPHQPWRKPFDYAKNKRMETLYHGGLWLLVFGLCYGLIPMYQIICRHFGFEPDLKKKDYSMKDKKLNLHRKFRIEFKAEVDPDMDWEFEPVQDSVILNAGETSLIFYRAFNREDKPIIGFSTYSVFPEEATLYFSKIQCFCFHQQLLNPKEELQLPLYFYLEPEIVDDTILDGVSTIRVLYKFIKSKKQDLAKMAEEELKRVEHNKKVLEEMRKKKKEAEK